jgi:iron complex outermembrane recepter protein
MFYRKPMLFGTSLAMVLAIVANPSMVRAQTTKIDQSADLTTRASAPTDTANAEVTGEILVTAQRRVQVAREVPVALFALAPDTIKTLDITDITTLGATVPGISSANQGLLGPAVVIRGISTNSVGIGGEVSVGVFVDEGAIGRPQSQAVPFLDVERIEVLRGPQGSLYGRNSTGGAISIVSNKPRFDKFRAEVAGSYGSFNSYDVTAVFNLPVSETFAARAALLARGEDGYDRNVAFNRNDQRKRIFGGRVSLAFEPSSKFRADLNISYSNQKTGAEPFKNIDPNIAAASNTDSDPFSGIFTHNVDGKQNLSSFGTNLTLVYDVADFVKLKSVTSYNRARFGELTDLDGSVLPLQEFENENGVAESFGQELRLSMETERFRLQLGANAYVENVRDNRSLTYDENVLLPLVIGAIPANALALGSPAFVPCDATSIALTGIACGPRTRERISQSGRYRSFAVFAEVEVKLSDTITAILGGRYAADRKQFSFSTPLIVSQGAALAGTNVLLGASTNSDQRIADTWKDFQPRAILRWQPNTLTNIYASVTRGFKSSGFDPAARRGVYDLALSKFGPETVWSYELGLKASLFDRRADLNMAGYRSIYRGYQVQVLNGGVTSTLNVPNYNAWGAEVDLTVRPISGVSFIVGGAYNSATYGNFLVDDPTNRGATQLNLRRNRGVLSPEFSAFARADGKFPLSGALQLRLGGDINWRTRQFFTIFSDQRQSQSFYTLVGCRQCAKFV